MTPFLIVQPLGHSGPLGSPVELKLEEGSIIKDERRTLVWRQRMPDGTPTVLKLYRHRIPSRLERWGFYTARAKREFQSLCHLEKHGVNCSAPLFWACGESTETGRYDLLASREVLDSVDLRDWLRNSGGNPPVDWTLLFALIAKLHQAGLQHGALQDRNILLAHGQFYLIDLPRSQRFGCSIEGFRPGLFDLKVLLQCLTNFIASETLVAGLAGYPKLPTPPSELVRSMQTHPLSSRRLNVLHALYTMQSVGSRFFSK